MEKQENKMNFKEHSAIFRRGVKYLFELNCSGTIYIILHAFLESIIPYIPIYFSAKLIDAIFEKASHSIIVWYVVLTVGLVFLLNLLCTWMKIAEFINWNSMCWQELWMYSKKEMSMEYSCTESHDVVSLLERCRLESQTGYNLFYLYDGFRNLIKQGTNIVASIAMTVSFFLLDAVPMPVKFSLIAGIIATVICGIFTTAKQEAINQNFFSNCADINMFDHKFAECLNNYNTGMDIRLYAMDDRIVNSIVNFNTNFYDIYLKSDAKRMALSIPFALLNHILKFGIYIILIAAVSEGAVSVGSIAKYVSCTMMLLNAISQLVKTLQQTFSNNYYLRRYFSYFDIPNTMYQGTLTVEKRLDTEYYIEFKDVSFRYPNTETYALHHVNLKFKIGEKLAVVGVNGSGKTTFIKLLCRLYDPTEGEILLNGVNIKKYDYDEYMSIFSVVFQDFQLFSFTVGQNVAAAKEYDRERVTKCLIRAGFKERLDIMPVGTDTFLYKDYDENGVEISGGEAQKIALARALYKDAPFIILDEPTAALDPVSEYEVYHKFNELAGDKTAVYISHRLASCRFCDNIVVFDSGSIIQHGSHEILVADTNGKYYELWNAQAQYYTDEKQKPDNSLTLRETMEM